MASIVTCPWCRTESRVTVGGRLFAHRADYMVIGNDCPCSGLTLSQARDKTDEAIMHHAATGE